MIHNLNLTEAFQGQTKLKIEEASRDEPTKAATVDEVAKRYVKDLVMFGSHSIFSAPQNDHLINVGGPGSAFDARKYLDTARPHQCQNCDMAFSKKDNLRQHNDAVHLKLKPFKCDYCDKRFAHKKNVQQHVLSVHQRHKPYPCDICGKHFARFQEVENHKMIVHDKVKPFQCNSSEKSFSR